MKTVKARPLRGLVLAFMAAYAMPGTRCEGAAKGADMNVELPRGELEANGVSPSRLLEFVRGLDAEVDSLHGFVLVRHGRVVAEGAWAPYDADTPHQLWSLTKSFTSMAVGLAISEGRFGLDEPILPHFAADAPADPPANLKAMTVRHLLTMTTGHDPEPPNDQWAKTWKTTFLAQPVPFAPGKHFVYNTPASGMLAALVERTTGMPIADYLKPRLFEPLGIREVIWWKVGDGTTAGGFGLHLRTPEIARFGQLLLQGGEWQGKQLVPRSWIEAATSRQVPNGDDPNNDWNQGYGYQFWMARHGAFRGDGAFGQFCIVMRDQDAVLAVTSGTPDMGKVMQLAWDKLLPALEPGPLKSDPKGVRALGRVLAGLTLRPVASVSKPAANLVGRRFRFPDNPRGIGRIGVGPRKGGATPLDLLLGGRERTIRCGGGTWIRGHLPGEGGLEEPVAVSGGWTAPDTFTARIAHLDSSFVDTIRLVFSGDELTLEQEMNVSFGPPRLPDLRGRLEPGVGR
ncbi:MAG: serine hydrolase [Candidatus Coatesbacteria bacterium]